MEITEKPTKKSKLTLYILIGMILGIVVGYYVHETYSASTVKVFADNIKLLTTIFLRMVQMAGLGVKLCCGLLRHRWFR